MTQFWERLKGKPWSGRVFVFGFQIWKPVRFTPFFGAETRVRYVGSVKRARRLGISAADRIAVWGLRDPAGLDGLARELGLDIVRVEDGFLRSVGLGADYIPPLSLVFDARGIYFDPGAPSDLEHILQHTAFDGEVLRQAQKLRACIVRERLTKYILPARPLRLAPARLAGRRIILVPGQVESDASILRGCGKVRTNLALLRAAREEEPDAFIIYKPHPDVMVGNRDGKVHLRRALDFCDHVETDADIVSCLDIADAVHTMTSLTGFDALLRGREVICHGQPFYAGWGLTRDHVPLPRRRRKLSLDELVAGTLLLYPRYMVDARGGFVSALEAARELARRRREASAPPTWRLARKWGRLARDLTLSLIMLARQERR